MTNEEREQLHITEMLIMGWEMKQCEKCGGLGDGCTLCEGKGYRWWWPLKTIGSVTGRISSHMPNLQNIPKAKR